MTRLTGFLFLFGGLIFPLITLAQLDPAEELEKYVVRVDAVGRTARLGSLYNGATEKFTSVSILNQAPPTNFVRRTDTPSTNTRFGLIKSYSDKANLLDVSASLTLSFLAGIIDVGGSGRYMRDEQSRSNSVVGSLVYETLTCEEILEIFYDDMRDHISAGTLENATESHVVVGIGYGVNAVVKFEDHNTENRDMTEIEASVRASLDLLLFGVSVEVGAGWGEENVAKFSNFSLQIYGDLIFDTDNYPTNVTQVVNFIQKIPKLIQSNNGGKGAQLFFYLLPIEKVKQFLLYEPPTLPPPIPPQPEIPADVIASEIQVFEEIQIVRLKLNDLYNLMMSHRDILNNFDLRMMQDLQNGFQNSTTEYKTSLRKGLIRLRSNVEPSKREDAKFVLGQIQKKFRDSDASLEVTENIIDNEFRDIRLKIELIEFLRGNGALWVGRSDSVDFSMIRFFRSAGAMNASLCSIHFHRIFLRNTILFVNAVSEAIKLNFVPLIVDCDFPHASCDPSGIQPKVCEPFFTPIAEFSENDGQMASNLVEFGSDMVSNN